MLRFFWLLLAWLYLQNRSGTADKEVRRLLQDVPVFDWAPAVSSRMAYENDDKLPNPPKDDSSPGVTLGFKGCL